MIIFVICHFFFCIYCTNKQIKILRLSTKNSFNSQHLKILMAPLYTTRSYAILSIISSILFLFILTICNTFNSLIYYPIFATLNTYFFSLIFARNRYLLCKCCNYKPDAVTVILDNNHKTQHIHTDTDTSNYYSCCIDCFRQKKKVVQNANLSKTNAAKTVSSREIDIEMMPNPLQLENKSTVNSQSHHEPICEDQNIHRLNSNILLPTHSNISLDTIKMSNVIKKLNKINNKNSLNINVNCVEYDEEVVDYTNVMHMENNIINNLTINNTHIHIKNVTAVNGTNNVTTPVLDYNDLEQNLDLLNKKLPTMLEECEQVIGIKILHKRETPLLIYYDARYIYKYKYNIKQSKSFTELLLLNKEAGEEKDDDDDDD
eukprot:397829_1